MFDMPVMVIGGSLKPTPPRPFEPCSARGLERYQKMIGAGCAAGAVATEIVAGVLGLDVFKLDVDANPEIAMRYGVSSIPTLLVFRDGEEVGRVVGALPKARIEAQLDEALGARA